MSYTVSKTEYDELEARTAAVIRDSDIDARLLAHCVHTFSGQSTAAATILQWNISPRMLAPLPFLRLDPGAVEAVRQVVGDPALWKLVCAAWATLLRIPAAQLDLHNDRLNDRLGTTAAELGITGKPAPPRALVKFRLPSAPAALPVADATAAVVVSPATSAKPPTSSVVTNRRFDDPSEESPFASVVPMAAPPPSYKFGTMPSNPSISVKYSSGYHRTRADCHGRDTVNPHHPVCHFHECVREWSLYTLRDHASLPVYFLCNWKTYCCSEHLDVLVDYTKGSVLFCHSCGALDTVGYYSSVCGNQTVPLCVECTKKPYVMRQFVVFFRREWRVGVGKNRRLPVHVNSKALRRAVAKKAPAQTLWLPRTADRSAGQPSRASMPMPMVPAKLPTPRVPWSMIFGTPAAEVLPLSAISEHAQPIVAASGRLTQPFVLDLADSPSTTGDVEDESTDHSDSSDGDYFA